MSKIEVNTVAPQCGTTLTLGESGDTVTLGTGASQSGFGRTGTVDWQTGSIKTATFTAANGEGYFANTSGGAFTMNLPAGTAGSIVSVVDYTNTFQTNQLIIAPNGSQKIGGVAASVFLTTEGQSVTFVYVDDTEGWKNVQDSTSNAVGNEFVIATGGTITEDGNFKIHTFTGPGTFAVTKVACSAPNNAVNYLVVAGGGGSARDNAGGGGAGGMRFFGSCVSPSPYPSSPRTAPAGVTVTAASFPIVVGGGGAGASPGCSAPGARGGSSSFSTITSTGGGGSNGDGQPASPNQPGGSGGGRGQGAPPPAGSGNTPPVSPSQGDDGGGDGGNPGGGGGGGGFLNAGSNRSGDTGGAGGDGGGFPPAHFGASNGVECASFRYFAGGAGGGSGQPGSGGGGAGGKGGGGAGGPGSGNDGTVGTDNTGGGGGGGAQGGEGANGGSGIVVIRYKFK
jgi:hypothetical protein